MTEPLQKLMDTAQAWSSQPLPASSSWLNDPDHALMDPHEAMLQLTARRDSWRARHGLPDGAQVRSILNSFELPAKEADNAASLAKHKAPGHASWPVDDEDEFACSELPHLPDEAAARDLADVARELWTDRWTDAEGHRWQVFVESDRYLREGSNSDYDLNTTDKDALAVLVEGFISCNGLVIGQFSRSIWPGDSQAWIEHGDILLRLDHRGKGFASRWLERSCARYQQLGVEQIALTTDWNGLAVWPRFGFDLDLHDDRRQGKPCAYAKSDYAVEMRRLLTETISWLDRRCAYAPESKSEMIQLREALTLARDDKSGPCRVTDLAQEYPELMLHVTHDMNQRLWASVETVASHVRARTRRPQLNTLHGASADITPVDGIHPSQDL